MKLKLFKFTDRAQDIECWIVAESRYLAACDYNNFNRDRGGLGDYTSIDEVTPESMIHELATLREGESFIIASVEHRDEDEEII
jgi:hypothetical protein